MTYRRDQTDNRRTEDDARVAKWPIKPCSPVDLRLEYDDGAPPTKRYACARYCGATSFSEKVSYKYRSGYDVDEGKPRGNGDARASVPLKRDAQRL